MKEYTLKSVKVSTTPAETKANPPEKTSRLQHFKLVAGKKEHTFKLTRISDAQSKDYFLTPANERIPVATIDSLMRQGHVRHSMSIDYKPSTQAEVLSDWDLFYNNDLAPHRNRAA